MTSVARHRVRNLVAEVRTAKGLRHEIALRRLEGELGLLPPGAVARTKALKEAYAQRKARRSAREIFDVVLPILRALKRYFVQAELPISQELINSLLQTDESKWVALAGSARRVAAALNIEWDVETVRELLELRPVEWLERKMAPTLKTGRATLHNLVYRKSSSKHRVAT